MKKISLRSILVYASIFGLLSFIICLSLTREDISIRKKQEHSIITPKILNKLASCFDNLDGVFCYSKYKTDIIREFKRNLKIDSVTWLEDCLETSTRDTSDLTMLLNIQKCYYITELKTVKAEKNSYRNSKSPFVNIPISVWSAIQVIAVFSTIIFFKSRDPFGRKWSSENETSNSSNPSDFLSEEGKIQVNSRSTKENMEDELREIIQKSTTENKDLLMLVDTSKDLRRAVEELNEICKNFQAQVPEIAIVPTGYFISAFGGYYLPKKGHTMENTLGEHEKKIGIPKITNNKSFWNPKSKSFPIFSHKEDFICNTPSTRDIRTDYASGKKASFDITTIEGRNKLKEHLKSQKQDKDDDIKKFKLKPVDANSNKQSCEKSHNDKTNENEESSVLDIQYQDIARFDHNNRKLKRVFLLGRGWISRKQLEFEEQKFGKTSYVRNTNV